MSTTRITRNPAALLLGLLLLALPLATGHALAGPGFETGDAAELDYTLTLGEQRFDPLVGIPAVPSGLDATRATTSDLQLVQFNGPIERAWVDALEDAGVRIVQYIHPYTYVVWCGPAQLSSLTTRDNAVRWTGPFLPAYRLLPTQRTRDTADEAVRVLVIRAADPDAVAAEIAALGARVDEPRFLGNRFAVIGCDISAALLPNVARIPGVYSVQAVPTDGGLRGEMSDQVCVNNIDEDHYAFTGYPAWLASIGLSGAGVIIANVDSGVQEDHPDLINRMLPCTGATCGGSAVSSHGTHTAGIMAADGSSGTLDSNGFLRGLGMAPGAELVEQVYNPFFTYPDGMRMLMSDSYNNGASISGNSWGPSSSPRGYDTDTLQVDMSVRDADPNVPGNEPLTYVLSIMNGSGGTSSQGTPDEAKNIFTVGSTKMQTYTGAQIQEIDDISANSAHGPALDGRKIPHIVAPGCYVDSTYHNGSYGLKCGTSMASPHVSGAVALFIEYYRLLPEYVTDPSPALIKAAFLPVAHDLAGNLDADGGVLGHRFDSKQGWGRMDVAAVVAPQVPVRYFDNPTVFDATGQQWVQSISVADTNQPLRIMLVWTDAPGHGLGGSTPAWNNDLDLIVEDGANTYHGNNFGADGWSAPGGTADYMNNTEGVIIGPTASGSYTVRVVATNINSDAIPDFGSETDQDFAIVIYNAAVGAGFSLSASPGADEHCVPDTAQFTIDVGQTGGFSDPVTLSIADLPTGVTADFVPNPVAPTGSSTLTVTTDASAATGEYTLQIVGQAAGLERFTAVALRLFNGAPAAITLVAPDNGATEQPPRPTFTWSPADDAQTYEIQIARDAAFTDLVFAATDLTAPTFALGTDLDGGATYFWRVRGVNLCGTGDYSTASSLTTRIIPPILLVDDDDNTPDVRTYYTDALAALSLDYDVWDTLNSDNEPNAANLNPYAVVLWFTGAEFGGAAGPGAAGEAALADFLAAGGNLLLSSQDYYYDRGMTELMSDFFGALSIGSNVAQVSVTGTGAVFADLGPYALSFPFTNYSDSVVPAAGSAIAFYGSVANAGISRDDPIYRTVFLTFPWEAIADPTDRAAVLAAALDWFRPYVDCNDNGIADHIDIYAGTSLDADGNGIPDECDASPLCDGDLNCDGVVNYVDIDFFVEALSHVGGIGWPHACPWLNGDCNGDDNVTYADIDPFVTRIGATCP